MNLATILSLLRAFNLTINLKVNFSMLPLFLRTINLSTIKLEKTISMI